MDKQIEIRVGAAQSDIVLPPDQPENKGGYELVGIAHPSGDRIWYDSQKQAKVTEHLGRNNLPFRAIISDFDGTVFDTEGDNGFFAVRFIQFLREAGVSGSDDDLRLLRHKAYKWQGTFAKSTLAMLLNIAEDRTETGKPFLNDELSQLQKILSSENLIRWANQSGRRYDDIISQAHNIIADRIEEIGKKILEDDPQRVVELAPVMAGAVDFIKAVPSDILFAIASASRKKTTIKPILEAYATIGQPYLRDRVGKNIVGEENLHGQIKPDKIFYQQAAVSLGDILHKDQQIPQGGVGAQDILFIGDSIAKSDILDIPGSRNMYHLVINAGVDGESLGPLSAGANDFLSLLEDLKRSRERLENATLRRLAYTLIPN